VPFILYTPLHDRGNFHIIPFFIRQNTYLQFFQPNCKINLNIFGILRDSGKGGIILNKIIKKTVPPLLAAGFLFGSVTGTVSAKEPNNLTKSEIKMQQEVIAHPYKKGSNEVQPNSLITNLAKKAIISAFRHGGTLLSKIVAKASPKTAKYIEKYSHKIANFLEELNKQEGPIASGLISLGLPPDVAIETAKIIVFFLGI
jgi:hypothetical protein